MEKKSLDEVMSAISRMAFQEEFDLVVGISRGGIIPAALVSQKINLPLEILHIRYRNDQHVPMYPHPTSLSPASFSFQGKRILLVDDVTRTGQTFKTAKKILRGASSIATFSIIGEADYTCFQGDCFRFPWLF